MRCMFVKSIASFAFMVLTVSSIAQGNHYFSGNTLHDPYGRFEINFLAEPVYNFQDAETDLGTVRVYQFMYEASATFVYMVSYVDYPADKMSGQNSESLLRAAAGGFINALNLTSRNESIINYGNYKGIYFAADDGSTYAVLRDFLVDNRLYQMGILQIGGAIDAKVENEFFDSFVLTK